MPNLPRFSLSRTLRLSPFVVAAALAACAPDIAPHGALPTEDQIATVKPGVSVQSDVLNNLGTASTTSMFDGGLSWIYIGSHTEQYAIFANTELDRHILVIRFNKAGTVEDVVTLTKENGKDLVLVARTTPTRGKDLNLIQELLNNVGRFSSDSNSTAKK